MIALLIEQLCIYTPLMLGAYLSIGIMKIPNLSIESAVILGALSAAQIIKATSISASAKLFLSIGMAALGGAIVGFFAATIAKIGGFSHLVSAILSIGFFHGVCQWLIGGTHITLSSHTNLLALLHIIPGYPEMFTLIAIAGLTTILFWLFMKTKLGFSCAFFGDNRAFLTSYRISEHYVITSGLCMSNMLAGISGYLIAQSNSFVDTSMAAGLPLLCITVLILGKTIYASYTISSIIHPIGGLTVYFIMQNLLLRSGFDLRYFASVQAVIVLAVLILGKYTHKNTHYDILGI